MPSWSASSPLAIAPKKLSARGRGSSDPGVVVSGGGECTTEGTERLSSIVELDLRLLRFLKALLMRLTVVWEPEVVSVSEEFVLDESEEVEESKTSAKTPGCDSSSIRSCGMLW